MKLKGKTTKGYEEQFPVVSHAQYFNKTGAAAIAETIDPISAWQLESIRVHLSAAGGAGDLTVDIDHHKGAVYDFNLVTQDMTSETDVVWSPNRPLEFRKGDKLVIAWANAGTKTYGLEIVWKEI